MMELEYIPLKTAEGVTCGHAKVRSGAVELSLKGTQGGEAVVLTDGGSFTGSPGTRIHTAGRVQAVAVREGDSLRCCGVARRSAYTAGEVRLRLSVQAAQRPKPEKAAPPPRPERQEEPGAERAKRREEPAAEQPERWEQPVPERPAPAQAQTPARAAVLQEAPQPERLMEDGLPFHPDTAIKQALSRLAEEAAAGFRLDAHPEPAVPKRALPASDPALPKQAQEEPASPWEDTAADTEAFSALMARADAVFEKILTPATDPAEGDPVRRDSVWRGPDGCDPDRGDSDGCDPAERDPAERDPVRRDPVWRDPDGCDPDRGDSDGCDPAESDPAWRGPDGRDPVWRDPGDWCGAVDRLLQAGAPGGHAPVQNPFPHIFPGARFQREGDGGAAALRGEWISGRERMRITAVRGDYSPQPPEHLPGFTRYIRAKSGGYWVKVEGAET